VVLDTNWAYYESEIDLMYRRHRFYQYSGYLMKKKGEENEVPEFMLEKSRKT